MNGFETIEEDQKDILGWERSIQIQVDHREKPSGILDLLGAYDVEVKVSTLRVGDYIVNDFATIERKTAHDFLISIIDGRLFTQASRMRTHCQNPILLIEGNWLETPLDLDPRAIKGALVSICGIWKIPVLFSDAIQESAEMLVMLARQEHKYTSHLSLRKGYRPKKLTSRQLFILQGLPSVGPRIAKRLLQHFGNVERVMTASEEELLQVEGIGRAIIQRIHEVLKSPLEKNRPTK